MYCGAAIFTRGDVSAASTCASAIVGVALLAYRCDATCPTMVSGENDCAAKLFAQVAKSVAN
jgi:hypothetical protein